MGKVNKVISYENLTPELQELMLKKYPNGYNDYVIKITMPTKEFWAVTLDAGDVSYLVKVPVKVDTNTDDLDEPHYGEEPSSSDDSFNDNADDFDNVADESSDD
jgi:hypothetical protein